MASLNIFDVAEVVAAVYPDDVGRQLLYTCTQLYRNEDINRAVLLTSLHATLNFGAYLSKCNNAERLRYVAAIVRERPHLHLHQLNGTTISSMEFAARHEQYGSVCILREFGFTNADRWIDEHGIFSYLCERAKGDLAAAAAALAFAQDRQPDGTWTFMGQAGGRSKDEGDTGFYRVCETGRADILAYWLQADRSAVVSQLEERYGEEGHTPFTAACYQAGITKRLTRSGISRKGATACAALLAALPECSPTTVGGLGMSNLYWACWAGRVDVVQRWLAHESVTAEWIVQGQGVNLEPLFAAVCSALRSGHIANEVVVKSAVRQCAGLVGCNPNCKPGSKTGRGSAQLFCAIDAGLTDVIEAWLRNAPSELASLMSARSYGPVQTGHTPFSAACEIAGSPTRNRWHRTGAETCARLLASLLECTPTTVGGDGNSHLYWACWAGIIDVVRRWLEHESVTAEWMAHDHREEVQPLFRAVCSAFDHHALTQKSSDLVPSVRQCAVLVGCNLVCKLVSTDGQVRPQLLCAIDFGLVEVVEALLQKLPSEDAAALQVQASGETGHTPFTAACNAAVQGDNMLSAGSAKCARLLASLSSCSPTAVGGHGYSNLFWACWAGLVDVVRELLEHESVTAEWMAQELGSSISMRGHLMSLLLYHLNLQRRKLPLRRSSDEIGTVLRSQPDRLRRSTNEIAAVLQCAYLVGTSGKCRPDTTGSGEGSDTNLHIACQLGLDAVLEFWLRTARDAVLSVLHRPSSSSGGQTPFAAACYASVGFRSARSLGAHRAGASACVSLLAALPEMSPVAVGGDGLGNIYWACRAYSVDAVARWLRHASVTTAFLDAVPPETEYSEAIPVLSALCVELCTCTGLVRSREEIRQFAVLIGTSGKCSPCSTSADGVPQLFGVCRAGLDEVLALWLKDQRQAVLSVLHQRIEDEMGHTSFTAACAAAVEDDGDWCDCVSTSGHSSEGECVACAARRPGALACATLLAALPECTPDTLGGDDEPYSYWAELAGVTLAAPQAGTALEGGGAGAAGAEAGL